MSKRAPAASEFGDIAEETRLLKVAPFRRLLESRIVGQTASNALVYALLVWLVQEEGSSIHATLLVIALTLPAAVIGIPVGVLADILPRRFTMAMCFLGRAAVAGALVYYGGDLGTIYLLVLAHASIGLLFGPAEAASIPAVVRRDQLPAANSLMTLGLMLGQIAGMVVLAPVLIKLFSPDAVFAVCALLFVVAAYIVAFMARGFSVPKEERAPSVGFVEAMREGFEILQTNRHAFLAMVYLVVAVALSKVLVILLPEYTRSVLDIEPEDAVFVAAPAAIGAGLGLLLVPVLARFLNAWRIAAFGFALFLTGLVALGMVVYVRDFLLENLDFGIGFVEDEVGVSSVITVAMLLAIPLGFSFTLLSVASRVVMNEQAPQEAQGRVFAVQMALADVLSLVPLLIVGIAADLFGVRTTLLTATTAAILVTGFLTFSGRFGPRPGREEAPAPAL